MKRTTRSPAAGSLLLAVALVLGGGLVNADPGAAADPAQKVADPFIPADFAPPRLVTTEDFKVVPLGPDLVKIDFDAYMSSIEHLQKTFSRSESWPTEGISDEDAMLDMENEQRRFRDRESFAYAVLTPDGTRERGCIYVHPSDRDGYDAVIRLWVTKAEYDAGFDGELYRWTRQWIESSWPFARVAYPGRSIDWQTWDAAAGQG